MTIEFFVVVTKEGAIRKSAQGSLRCYADKGAAQRWCRTYGDTVTVAVVDLERQPLFIRGQVVQPDAS